MKSGKEGDRALMGTTAFLRHLLRAMWADPGHVVVVGITSLIGVGFSIVTPLGFKFLLDSAIPNRDTTALAVIISVLGSLFIANVIAKLIEDRFLARLAARVLKRLRSRLFEQFQAQSENYFRRFDVGDLLARFTSDTQVIERILIRTLPGIFQKLLLLLIGLATLFVLEWRLALVALIGIPLAMAISARLRRKAVTEGHLRREEDARLTQVVQEDLGLKRVIHTLGLETRRREIFEERQRRLEEKTASMNFAAALVWRASTFGVELTLIFIMGLGSWLVFAGTLSVGDLAAFVALLLNVSIAVAGLAGFMPDIIRGQVSLQRIEECLVDDPEISELPAATNLPQLSETIELKSVTFGYGKDEANLKEIDLAVPAMQSLALVGRSGAGKSTVLNLILRLHDPWEGEIQIDGVDLKKGTFDSLRRQIGVVPQDTALFNTTIRENIRAGRLDATDEEVIEAAQEAEVHEFICALPDGYDTIVGERGGRLSGGQRQRIAIARALIRKPKVLLLDEATSALDPSTEQAIVETLRKARRGRTVVSVTHRLTTITDFDRIAVIDDGGVAEIGTHDSLLARGGTYAEIWLRQDGLKISDGGQSARVEANYLRQMPWLDGLGLSEDFLEELAEQFHSETFPAGRLIFDAGEPGLKFYLLVRGALTVEVGEDPGMKEVATLMDGDWFGEIALLRDIPRTARVTAKEDSICLALHRDSFRSMVGSSPDLLRRFEQVAMKRLAELEETPEFTGTRGVYTAGSESEDLGEPRRKAG